MRKLLLLIICLSPLNSFAGNSWVTQYSSGYVTDISFPDSLHGWAVELKKSAPYGKEFNRILFTNDGGKIWTEKPTAVTADSHHFIDRICFADSLRGLAGGWWWTNQTTSGYVGTGWLLASTTNGFGTYNSTGSGIGSHYQSGHVITMETAAGKLFWSCYEGGLSGISIYLNGKYIGWSRIGPICFVDTSYGWVCCDFQLFRTTKGVDSLHSLYSFSMNDIDFIDNLHGWAVGDTGKILYTDNGGTDSIWEPLTSGVTNNLTCVKFVDSLNGWAGGSGIILRTRDGGQTWASEGSYTVSKICAIDTTYAWALSGGNILKYHPYVGIEENWSEATSRLGGTALQISQNPFSKSTVITYQLPQFSSAAGGLSPLPFALCVYDLSGRLVKNLLPNLTYTKPFPHKVGIRDPYPAKLDLSNSTNSTCSVTLNATELKTGIYFVRLTAGNTKETKKLILIK
jgi:hypothetical protein